MGPANPLDAASNATGGNEMTDMVEPVARAIYVSISAGRSVRPWEDIPAPLRAPYLKDAIAAIKAMREPTEEMVGLGEHCADACYKIDPCNDGPRHIWQTMIDAALGENK